MSKFVVLLVLALLASAQNGTDVLTNETIIKMVQAGVPAATIIKTIAAADKVDFRFIGPDLQRLVVDAKVPDEVFKAMAAKDKGLPISVNTSVPSVRPSPPTPTPSPVRVEPQKPPTRTDTEAGLTNDSLVRLVKAGMGEDVIVGIVNNQPGQYSVTPDSLIALKQAGVSDKIIAAVVNRNVGARPTGVAQVSSTESVLVHDGTPVRLRLTRNLSSADAKKGETVDFEVLEDVKVDDVLVVARGATAIATVTEAEHKKRMARGGKLDINIDYVRIVNGDKIALRAVKETSGGGHTGAMTGGIVATSLVFFPAAPFFLFMHGKDTTIPKGTEISAYVDGEIKLDRQKLLVKQ